MSAPAQVTEAHKQLVATIVEQAFRFAEGNHKITPLSQLIADSEAKACAELRAEVERLREWQAGVIANERLHHAERKDAIARAESYEAELAGIRALANRRNKRDHSKDTTHQLVAALDQALDIAQAELAAERARLDWLESKCPILWSLADHATGPYWLLTDFPGYTEETASQHKTARAAIDAAMKEETK